MARSPNYFVDNLTGDSYAWEVNHLEESNFGKTRQIESTARSAPGLALIQQQGPDTPMSLSLTGTIMSPNQHAKFILFWQRSKDRTIFFVDFAGHTYEVTITGYNPVREYKVLNPKGVGTWMQNCVIRYTLDMLVVKIHSGPWVGVTP